MRLLCARLPLAVALLGLAVPATASAVQPAAITPTITEYTTGMPAGSAPHGMTLGDDGNVWFADHGIPTAEAIGFITPAGAITRYTAGISNNAGVEDVVQGPGGIWFTEYQAGQLGVATPGGSITEFGGLSSDPTGIAAGPDGNVWYSATSGSDAVGQITLAANVTEFQAGLSGGASPRDITPGPDGNLWFTEPGNQSLGRMTPLGTVTEYAAGVTGDPQEITAGPDGNLWFTQTSPSAIGRVTPLGSVTMFTAGLPGGSAPQAITTGADGNLYFTDNGANAIGQVTPAGSITEFSSGITPGADLKGITTGSDGALWFAEHIGAIGRMSVGPVAGSTAVLSVSDTKVNLKATVQPNAAAFTAAFEYGTTTAYGDNVVAAVNGSANAHSVNAQATGLAPGTTYHVRSVVTTATGVAHGPDQSFTTDPESDAPAASELAAENAAAQAPAGASPGAADGTSPSSAATTPAPVFGASVVGGVTSGTVLVTDPGGRTWRMGKGDRVKSGSKIDARRGRVRIVSALGAAGRRTQHADFWGGVFTVRQPRGAHGTVDIHLDGEPAGCGSAAARAARKGGPVKLWGKDRGGRYRTIGKSSVATVRGTEWLVMETCAGTVTRVVEGAVSVWDRNLHKRILLTAGPRAAAHLARASR